MNTISASNPYVHQTAYHPPATAPTKHSEASKTSSHEDTVHLSSAAKATLGDADHDGHKH